LTIEQLNLTNEQLKVIQQVLSLLLKIDCNGGHGKVFIDVCKKVVEVKGTIHLSGK
jgi:hypothetical protein